MGPLTHAPRQRRRGSFFSTAPPPQTQILCVTSQGGITSLPVKFNALLCKKIVKMSTMGPIRLKGKGRKNVAF